CSFTFSDPPPHIALPPFPTRRSSDLRASNRLLVLPCNVSRPIRNRADGSSFKTAHHRSITRSLTFSSLWREPKVTLPVRCSGGRSEEHTSELQSRVDLVCRLLLEYII